MALQRAAGLCNVLSVARQRPRLEAALRSDLRPPATDLDSAPPTKIKHSAKPVTRRERDSMARQPPQLRVRALARLATRRDRNRARRLVETTKILSPDPMPEIRGPRKTRVAKQQSSAPGTKPRGDGNALVAVTKPRESEWRGSPGGDPTSETGTDTKTRAKTSGARALAPLESAPPAAPATTLEYAPPATKRVSTTTTRV